MYATPYTYGRIDHCIDRVRVQSKAANDYYIIKSICSKMINKRWKYGEMFINPK